MTDPNNGHLGYRHLWHWLNTLFGRHDHVTGVDLKHYDEINRTIIAWRCETCGHSWTETRRK